MVMPDAAMFGNNGLYSSQRLAMDFVIGVIEWAAYPAEKALDISASGVAEPARDKWAISVPRAGAPDW